MINVTRSSMPSFEEYCEEIKELWDSRWLTNMGIKHRTLQAKLEEYLNVPHVTLYTNGHLALENAISAMNLPKSSNFFLLSQVLIFPSHILNIFRFLLFSHCTNSCTGKQQAGTNQQQDNARNAAAHRDRKLRCQRHNKHFYNRNQCICRTIII